MSIPQVPLKDSLIAKAGALSGNWLAFFLEIYRLFSGNSFNSQSLDDVVVTGITGNFTVTGSLVYDRCFCWVEYVITPETTIDFSDISLTPDTDWTKVPLNFVPVTLLVSSSVPVTLPGMIDVNGTITTSGTGTGISDQITIAGQFLISFRI